jgi:hypothetical protein
MTRRATRYILAATVASFGATIVATSLYLVFVLGDDFDLAASFFFGLQPALRGVVLAAPAALAFSRVRYHFNRIAFTVAASVTAGALGVLLGFWVVGASPHVSDRIAAALLASTWATTACLLSALTAQSPN